jgi:hypothetical protein
LKPAIEAQQHHPPQPILVEAKELPQGVFVPLLGPVEQVLRFTGVVRHNEAHFLIIARRLGESTEKFHFFRISKLLTQN